VTGSKSDAAVVSPSPLASVPPVVPAALLSAAWLSLPHAVMDKSIAAISTLDTSFFFMKKPSLKNLIYVVGFIAVST
jgi:hypothetical protein